MLWFDVGIVRYTTGTFITNFFCWLWFDVGIVRYTTKNQEIRNGFELWFDVGIVRYTTRIPNTQRVKSCGLM